MARSGLDSCERPDQDNSQKKQRNWETEPVIEWDTVQELREKQESIPLEPLILDEHSVKLQNNCRSDMKGLFFILHLFLINFYVFWGRRLHFWIKNVDSFENGPTHNWIVHAADWTVKTSLNFDHLKSPSGQTLIPWSTEKNIVWTSTNIPTLDQCHIEKGNGSSWNKEEAEIRFFRKQPFVCSGRSQNIWSIGSVPERFVF